MPLLTPSRRWQKAYYPFKKRKLTDRIEESFERTLKGLVWGCRMCGNCLLQETAFICPMACPKGLRNGPCGGSTPDHCCVDESRPCIWYAIYNRADKMGRLELLLEVLPPLDWDKTGTSALKDVYTKINDHGVARKVSTVVQSTPLERKERWNRFFKEIRQPDWWASDALPHPAAEHDPVSGFEQVLVNGKFLLTCEVVPPLSASFAKFDNTVSELKGIVDAINITDGASAVPRVSAVASAVRCLELGIEPILQMAARDRTRLSFQADLLGASAMGIRNLLLITGDHVNKGVAPFSKMDVWDYDSIQALWMARKLRDEGLFVDGRQIKNRPAYLIGAAAAPFASKPKYQALRAEKKINAGAQFFQTNLVYDIARFQEYLEALDNRNVLGRVPLIAGFAPIRSMNAAHYLASLPGITIPDEIMERLSNTKDFKKESNQISLEIIEKLKSNPCVRGIHFMAIGDVSELKSLISESGLLN